MLTRFRRGLLPTALVTFVVLQAVTSRGQGPGRRAEAEPAKTPEEQPFRSAADRPVDILHIKLDLRVDIPKKLAAGTATIDLTALRDVRSVRFDAVDFHIGSVRLARGEGQEGVAEYINDGESIEVLLGDEPLTAGSRATVTIEYSVTNPRDGLHFFGPTPAEPDTPLVVWSQGESVENRYWVPCLDNPNEFQTNEMVITADAGNEVISNGKLLEKQDNPNGTVTFHWLQDKPHAAYLMTLIVGPFYSEQETWRGKPVVYNVPPDRRDDLRRTFGNTVRMLEHFSTITGVEYPWAKYTQTCVAEFGGGMENVSATTLGPGTLHDERAHLDFSSDGLVSHELAHQWFGDLVTCKDWSHLWLNEGFASYMEPVWYEYDLGRNEYDYAIYEDMKSAIRGGKDRPVVDIHYERPDDMFDSRSYPKGSSILHMLRERVGDENFWKSVNQYLTDHAHQPVETSDLRKAFERVTGQSLERFFHDWTLRPGAPSLDVSYNWNEQEGLAEISVKQTQKDEPFAIPIEIEFRGEGYDPIFVRREMTEKDARFVFPLPKHPTMVLFDPREAVLKEIKERKGRDLWEAQLTSAPYVVSRIRAAVHFGEAGGDRDVEALGKALGSEPFWGVGVEIAEALGQAGGEKARDALLAGLSAGHPKVRAACADQLGTFHGDEQVTSTLYSLIQKGDPSYRVEAAAIRSYGKLQPEGAVAFLTPLLSRTSHRDQIQSAVLGALGDQKEPSGLATLLDWTKPGKPRFCRTAAIGALGDLAENVDLSDTDLARIVETISANLRGEQRWVKGAAMRALGGLGAAAKPALAALRDIEANDPDRRARRTAKDAIEKITKAEPPNVQVDDLRKELDKLREENKELKERLDKLEAKSPGNRTERDP